MKKKSKKKKNNVNLIATPANRNIDENQRIQKKNSKLKLILNDEKNEEFVSYSINKKEKNKTTKKKNKYKMSFIRSESMFSSIFPEEVFSA